MKSSGPIGKQNIPSGSLTKQYSSLRYSSKRPVPTSDEVNLAREEDFFMLDEPQSQQALRTQASNALNVLKETLSSSPLNEDVMQQAVVTSTITPFSALSLESLQSVYSSVEKDPELK